MKLPILAAILILTLMPAVGSTTGTSPIPAPTQEVTVSPSASGSMRSYGFGSASPSANACQRVVLFMFSFDVESCMLQQWGITYLTTSTNKLEDL